MKNVRILKDSLILESLLEILRTEKARCFTSLYRVADTRGTEGTMSPPFVLGSKKKKGKQRQTGKTFKAETIKGCH